LRGLRARAVYLGYRAGAAALRLLPEPLSVLAASAGGLVLGDFQRDARKMYARHVERVLGRALTDKELRSWTRRVFANYGRYWMEGARISSVKPQVILDRLNLESGLHYLVEHMAQGNGVVLALPHVGTWEWGGAWLALQGYPMTSVAEPVEPRELYEYFLAQREAMGLRILPMDAEVGGALLRTLRSGGLVGLICDRDIFKNGIEVEFFGERTTLPGGPATLALRSGAALLPAAVYSGPGHHHTAVILPPIDTSRTGSLREDVTRVTQALAFDLEKLIRRGLDQWYVFHPNWPSDTDAPGDGAR